VDIHIGKEIHKIYKQRRFGQAELAQLINTSPQNVHALFKRKSIDTSQLLIISKALNFDFFSLYSKELTLEKINSAQGSLLDECKKEKQILEDKFKLQTENATNQRKYIEMLEDKFNSNDQYNRGIIEKKDELMKKLQDYTAALEKKLEKYEKKS
jgi:DNA-binding Xre family transcriptional regulator